MIATASRIGLMMSTAGFAVLASTDPITTGSELARLGVAGVLGVVSVVSVMGMLRVYKDKQAENSQHDEKLYKLIETSTQSMSSNAEMLRAQTSILVEVKDAIVKCKAKD